MRLGAFVLERPIGQGGMAQVWAGRHPFGSVPVAIKVMNAKLAGDPRFRRGFEQEVRAVAALNHPGIVAVHDCGVVGPDVAQLPAGSPWLAMDLAPNGDLLRHPPPANWSTLRRVLMGLLGALAHAHARGVVHRDLKPANVLIGRGEQLILTDFGIARVGRGQADQTGSVSGTPQYMAPEQIRGQWRDVGPWTDLYSLGCVAYEMVCGRTPFTGNTPVAVAMEQLRSEPPPLAPRFPLPDGFAAWLDRLLAKDFNRRFACAADAAWRLGLLEDVAGDGDGFALGEAMTEAMTLSTLVEPARFAPRDETAAPLADPPPFVGEWRDTTPFRSSLQGVGQGLFGLRVPPLFGHDSLRDQLWAQLERVHASRKPAAVVIEGAEGAGKTRLAQWLAWRAVELGAAAVHRVGHGPVRDATSGVSGALRDAFGGHGLEPDALAPRVLDLLRRIDPTADPDALARDVPALVALMRPTKRGSGVALTPAERYAAITRWVARAARQRPLIIWIDDAQWGAEAVGFARHLLTQDVAALLVVCSQARTPELAALVEAGAEQMTVGPLSRAHQSRFARALLGLAPSTVEQLLNHTAGRPRFIQHLLASWIEREALVLREAGFAAPVGDWPTDERAVITRRLAHHLDALPVTDARLSATVAATLGRAVEQSIWAAACAALGVEAPPAVVDALAHCGLARLGATGWAFTDESARRVLLEAAQADPQWPAINAACAAALADRPDLLPNRATHLLAAGDRDAALDALEAAIQAALDGGDYAAALGLIKRHQGLAATLPEGDRRRAVTLPLEADVHRFTGQAEAATAAAERLSVWLESNDDLPLRQGLARVRGAAGFLVGRFDEHFAHYQVAARLAEQMGDPRILTEALHGLAWGTLLLGRNQEAQALYQRCKTIADAHDLGDQAAWALHGLAGARTFALDPNGREPAREAERYFTAQGSVRGRANALFFLGEGDRLAGDFESCRHHLTQARDLWRSIGSAFAAFAEMGLMNLALETGDLETAARGYHVVLGLEGLTRAYRPQPFLGLATVAALTGDVDAFDRYFGDYEALMAQPAAQHPSHQLYTVRCGEAWEAAGDRARARRAWQMAARNWAALDPGKAAEYAARSGVG